MRRSMQHHVLQVPGWGRWQAPRRRQARLHALTAAPMGCWLSPRPQVMPAYSKLESADAIKAAQKDAGACAH